MRTASFSNVSVIPAMLPGTLVPDLIAILGRSSSWSATSTIVRQRRLEGPGEPSVSPFPRKSCSTVRTVVPIPSLGMNTEQVGSFRTRVADDGSLEVWARGWRLESQLYALVPMGLALGFLLAPCRHRCARRVPSS